MEPAILDNCPHNSRMWGYSNWLLVNTSITFEVWSTRAIGQHNTQLLRGTSRDCCFPTTSTYAYVQPWISQVYLKVSLEIETQCTTTAKTYEATTIYLLSISSCMEGNTPNIILEKICTNVTFTSDLLVIHECVMYQRLQQVALHMKTKSNFRG